MINHLRSKLFSEIVIHCHLFKRYSVHYAWSCHNLVTYCISHLPHFLWCRTCGSYHNSTRSSVAVPRRHFRWTHIFGIIDRASTIPVRPLLHSEQFLRSSTSTNTALTRLIVYRRIVLFHPFPVLSSVAHIFRTLERTNSLHLRIASALSYVLRA